MSSTMRNILGSFLRLYARPEASPARLLFATPVRRAPRDRHAWRRDARRQQRPGRRVSRSRSSGARNRRQREAGRRTGAGAGVDHGVGEEERRERELRTIVRDLPKDVELWAGGRGAGRVTPRSSARGDWFFGDYNAYQQELVRIGGRVA